MNFQAVLEYFRSDSLNEHEKGSKFEKLIRAWFLADPRYSSDLTHVWLWHDFPSKQDFGGTDLGVDLVARTDYGEYWAIQCKFYAEGTSITKATVDSFLATSSRLFTDPVTGAKNTAFSRRVWVSTTEKWGSNAEQTIQNQSIPFQRITLETLEDSVVNWDALVFGKPFERTLKSPMDHQKDAMSKAHGYFAEHERGKLIMACGTGKTYTSLAIVEQETRGQGRVLVMVPSIALLGQTLNAWMADASYPMKAICICSDPKSSQRQHSDDTDSSVIDLALPATTDSKVITSRFAHYRDFEGLLVVFSTYQSIDAVAEAQREVRKSLGDFGVFDWIVCDEAHRTTGVKLSGSDESAFTKIHDNTIIEGRRRLYMTATPRLYGDTAKAKAIEKDQVLCSMDNPALYGDEFFRVGFSYAVTHGLLTDYKVLVLTVGGEKDLPPDILAQVRDKNRKELDFDMASRLVGCLCGLSKKIKGDNGVTWETDPGLMRRALAFCPNINKNGDTSSSMNTAEQLPDLSRSYRAAKSEEDRENIVHIQAQHIDGSMNSQVRSQKLSWLKADIEDKNECRLLCNVRCLSEGVDVPALDAVLFLSARNSQVDVVQSVGRVMRNFRKGKPGEKKYGYIIIPVVVPPNMSPEEALKDNARFGVVWSILNALRSHDDNFNAIINKINLNNEKPGKIVVGGVQPFGDTDSTDAEKKEAEAVDEKVVSKQLSLLGDLKNAIFARMVEKVGDRLYWEKWAKDVGVVARNFISRITELVSAPGTHRDEFEEFVTALRNTINESITQEQAVEMLAQHLITRPVFEALFKDYQFATNNPVCRSMEKMIDVLVDAGLEKDTTKLNTFYESVRMNVGDIDNLEGKQEVIKNLYERFFKGAFPKTVDQLGIVYTPVECVDFILRSVNDVLKKEFDCTLSDENVHILDPFTGTGTFITRLLQTGLIRPEDMERKYRHEIHCNEIVLLAYYVADVNIESVFHDVTGRKDYLKFDNICLTDTFEQAERHEACLYQTFKDNSEAVTRQKKLPIRVIVGNPPYSAGQKSANDNAQNVKYPGLDARIEETYVAGAQATNKNSLYDSYIRAFRWASDRIRQNNEGGIIGFITNSKWLDGGATAGFRRCLEEEFSSICVFDLRGAIRGKSGEIAKKEGGNVFDIMTGVCLVLLVYNPAHVGKSTIRYCDIGDYLNHKEKLKIVVNNRSVLSRAMHWTTLEPNEHGDWLNQRSDLFGSFVLIGDKKEKAKQTFFEPCYSNGLKTQRDIWCYNYSENTLKVNISKAIDFYNLHCDNVAGVTDIVYDTTQFSWSDYAKKKVLICEKFSVTDGRLVTAHYRPFMQQNLFFSRQLNERVYQIPQLFPTSQHQNKLICVESPGSRKDFSAIIVDKIPDLHLLEAAQCFPRYYYKERDARRGSLLDSGKLDSSSDSYERKDGVTDWILKNIRTRFQNTRAITKDHIFYYVYGILHSPDYRERFNADLKKSLPRIPIVDTVETFMEFSTKGKELAELHLNYESVPAHPHVTVAGAENGNFVVEKMRFADKATKACIIYNSHIRVQNIPAEAYEYVVNGRSAIEWVMESYRIKTDKDSGITNDPNDWAKEHDKPRYILDLLLSVINVSTQTVNLVRSLPRLNFEETSGENSNES